jgi:DNA polymerase-3 subunit epsilon
VSGWHKQRLGVFDLETTAPDPDEARIVTACIGAVGGEFEPRVEQTIVNPGVEIPQGAIDVHGITNERARSEGEDPGISVERFAEEITTLWGAGMPLVAFNACYDLTVMDRECRRHLGHGFEITGYVIDPFVIDREVDKYRKGKRTLGVTADLYRVKLNGAHDATEDALAAGRIAWRIAETYPEIAVMTLDELHEAQTVWHAARQADFRAYLDRQGKPSDDVFGDWPMRPYRQEVTA